MKTIVVLENGSKFTFIKRERTTRVKIKGKPVVYEVVELTTPKEGEILKFKYDAGCWVDEYKSSSPIISITME